MTLRKKTIFAFLIVPAVFAAAGMILLHRPYNKIDEQTKLAENNAVREIGVEVDMNKQLFYGAIEEYPRLERKDNIAFSGGIISHHDLASRLIAQFFSRLSEDKNIKAFVILGPDHANDGRAPVISGHVLWQTELGPVQNDYGFLDRLRDEGLIAYDDDNFRKDHAVAALVPFIRHYFPDAKIAPLLFTSRETMEKDILLVQRIKDLSNDGTFILASLDFSHYLPADTADQKDEITLAAINRKDYGQISHFNNDNVDSPWALITFLQIMDIEGAGDMQVIDHANSGRFPGQDPTNTTSYFSIVYSK